MALGYPAMKDPSTAGPRWILHPTLIGAAFVLEIVFANKIEPAGFARALAVAIVVGIGLTVACWAATRDRWMGGLLATTIVVAIVSIIPFFDTWKVLRSAFGEGVALTAFATALALLLAVPAVQRMRAHRGAPLIRRPATSILNRFAAILVLVIVSYHALPDVPRTIADAFRPQAHVAITPISPLPDIYVLLLDGYPRSDVLERRFKIDNSSFLDELRNLGFDVGIDNHSNYVFTQLTLASMFQMRHIEDQPNLAPFVGKPGAAVNELRDAMIESPLFATLREAGYEIVVTQPGYEHVALRGAADRVLEHGEMNDLERGLLKRTWLLDPLGALIPTLFTGPPRDRVVHAFDDLTRLGAESRSHPVFAWIHVPAPHLPLVLDAQGQALDFDPRLFDGHDAAGFKMTEAEYVTAYRDEITYLDTRVLTAIRALEASSARSDPVIVVMSDHGYTADLADIQGRLSNLFAAYTPQAPGLFTDPPTPVNVMAILLNRLLGTHFGMSADRYFLSSDEYHLLELTEVPNPG